VTQASDILERLPADFDIEAAQTKYPVTYGESMNTVLCQELGRANVLLRIIRNSMQDLKKAVRGLILMSEEMDVVGQRLFNGKVGAGETSSHGHCLYNQPCIWGSSQHDTPATLLHVTHTCFTLAHLPQ
jgi:hypothetical protein